MIDLLRIEPAEAERLAYAEGFGMAAQLFAKIADLQRELSDAKNQIEQLQDDLYVARYERAYGEGDA